MNLAVCEKRASFRKYPLSQGYKLHFLARLISNHFDVIKVCTCLIVFIDTSIILERGLRKKGVLFPSHKGYTGPLRFFLDLRKSSRRLPL